MAHDYFEPFGYVEFLEFSGRLAAVVWLYRTLRATLTREVEGLRTLRASGRHREPSFWRHDPDSFAAWFGPAECDLVLDESLGLLEGDAGPISGGVIIMSGTAALESLTTTLLELPPGSPLRKAGIKRKVAELVRRWGDAIDKESLNGHIEWLAERRNAFAHNLIDGEGRSSVAEQFGAEEVEEALTRIGAVASLLEKGWRQLIGEK
jgi:hypothetical protein